MKNSSLTIPNQATMQPLRSWYLPVKCLVDFVVGLTLLVVLSPIIALAAILVKATSPGPAFYFQSRVGKNGKLFWIIKLRSMRHDAEAGTGAVWCTAADDRITPFGRILRATHLDEFPQLLNVVKGDMSLVGPRPERPEFVHKFELQIDGYAGRLLVRPGITGIAQLRLPPDTDLEGVKDKLEFDLYYVRHVSPWLDFVSVVYTGLNFASSMIRALVPASLRVPTQSTVRAESPCQPLESAVKPAASLPARREQTVSGATSGTMVTTM